MSNTLYLADTCSLCNADMRAYWERDFFPHPDRKLTILFTVMCELTRRSVCHPKAKAALAFLKAHAEQVILLPEQDGYPANSVADREIFYHCALRQDRDVVLYTEDKPLASALTRFNPMANIQRIQKGVMTLFSSSWHNVYARLAEKYIIYLTADCVNSPAFAAAMQQPGIASLFRGRMMLSTASLPLLNEQGRATLRALEEQQLAPTLRLQGHICVSERDELTARLLTHSGTPSAMLWLGEGDDARDYLDLSKMQFAALEHKGYAVAVLKGNGRLYVQQQEPADPAEPMPYVEAKMPEPKEPAVSNAPEDPDTPAIPAAPTVSAAPVSPAEPAAPAVSAPAPAAATEKDLLLECLLQGDVKKAGTLLEANHKLISQAVKICFEGHIDKLLPLLNSLSQRKLKVPANSLMHYIENYLPQEKTALEAHLNDDGLQKVLRRMIKMSLVPPDKHAKAIQTLLQLKETLGVREATRVQNLIDVARLAAQQ